MNTLKKEYIFKNNIFVLEMECTEMTYKIYITIDKKRYIISRGWLLNNEIIIDDIMLQDLKYQKMFKNNKIDKYMNKGFYLKYTGKGYGTATLKHIIEFAKQNNFHTIKGELAEIDKNTKIDPTHRERQIHFYKKFEFKILPNEQNPKKIELNFNERSCQNELGEN